MENLGRINGFGLNCYRLDVGHSYWTMPVLNRPSRSSIDPRVVLLGSILSTRCNGSIKSTGLVMSEHSSFPSRANREWFLILLLLGTLLAGYPMFHADLFFTNITKEKIDDLAV